MFRAIPKLYRPVTRCLVTLPQSTQRVIFRPNNAFIRTFAEQIEKNVSENITKVAQDVSKQANKVIEESIPKTLNEAATKNTAESAVKAKKTYSKPQKWAFAFGIGFVASGLGSMVGLGGGFIMIPMLTGFFGASQHMAQGTSLAAIVATGLTSAVTYYQNGAVDVPAALVLTCTAMILSQCSARFTGRFNSRTLKKIFGWFSILIAPTVPLKSYLLEYSKKKQLEQQSTLSTLPSSQPTPVSTINNNNNNNINATIANNNINNDITTNDSITATTNTTDNINNTTTVSTTTTTNDQEQTIWKRFIHKLMEGTMATTEWRTLLGTGVFSGFISGFFGVGGGSVITPALFIPSFTGAYTHYRLGHLMTPILIPLMAGTILGGYVGPKLAMKCDAKKLKYLFMFILMASGIKSIM
ncbi:hypothetical protein WA158_003173 [Blastocystis sp. Blastoise]